MQLNISERFYCIFHVVPLFSLQSGGYTAPAEHNNVHKLKKSLFLSGVKYYYTLLFAFQNDYKQYMSRGRGMRGTRSRGGGGCRIG
jgi:hypothetical protein